MRFAAWLRSEMARRKLGNNALAQRLGVSTSAVSQYRRALRNPRADARAALADFFKVSPEYIDGLLPAESTAETETFAQDSSRLTTGIMDALAEQVAERTAGAVLRSVAPLFHHLNTDHYTEEHWLRIATPRVIKRERRSVGETGGTREDRYVLWEARVRGDCMAPAIPAGALVLIDRRRAQPGDTVALSIGDDVMVKRLAVRNNRERVLVGENGEVVQPGGERRVMGVVCFVEVPRGATDVL
jgi:transcriptional regulator with XRE-family HTH domain